METIVPALVAKSLGRLDTEFPTAKPRDKIVVNVFIGVEASATELHAGLNTWASGLTHIRQLVFCPVAASRLNLRRSRLAKPRPLNLHHRAKMARSGARAPAGQTLRGSQPRTARSLRRTALRAGASPALQCVRRAPHTQAAPVQDVGVDHRGADVPMPQQLLHRADVGTGVE